MVLQCVEFLVNSLLDVFTMDMSYFEKNVPVIKDFQTILLAMGWALLIGNLVFQASKTMMTGIGFEGEDPKLLFTRTFVFSFLLIASRPICNIGLGITSTLMELLQAPTSIIMTLPEDDTFAMSGDASWLLTLIVGTVLMFQLIKLLFEVGERYVVLGVLTLIAPLAFGMGGSKNTSDIFTGFCRMYGSMCLMMIFNMLFLKMFLSCMAAMSTGLAIFPWLVLMIGIARVAKKIDSIISRIGLNPAITGAPLGAGLPGALAVMVARSLAQNVTKSIGKNIGRPAPAGSPPPGGTPIAPPPGSHPPPVAVRPDSGAVKSAEPQSSQDTADAQISAQAPAASGGPERRTSVPDQSAHRPPLRVQPPVRTEGQQNRPQGSAEQPAARPNVMGGRTPTENRPRQDRNGVIIPPGASAGSSNLRASSRLQNGAATAINPASVSRPVTAGTTVAQNPSVQSAAQRTGNESSRQAAAPERPPRQPAPGIPSGNQQANLYSSSAQTAQTSPASPPNLKQGKSGNRGVSMSGESFRIQNSIDGRTANQVAQNVQSTASSRADSFSSSVYQNRSNGHAAPTARRSQTGPNPQGNAAVTPPASPPGTVHSINPPVKTLGTPSPNATARPESLPHGVDKALSKPAERPRITSVQPRPSELPRQNQAAGKGAVPVIPQALAHPPTSASRPRLPRKPKVKTAEYRKRRRKEK